MLEHIQMVQQNVLRHLLGIMLQAQGKALLHHVELEHIKMKKGKQVVKHVLLEAIKMKQENLVVKHVK